MYIEVERDGEIAEFWDVRAWNYSEDGKVLWIFFFDENINCGYIENAKVVNSFTGYTVNDNESLPNEFLDWLK